MQTLNPIFEFDTIFDLDYTLIAYIQNRYKNSKFFNFNIDEDPVGIKYLLQERQDPNPLSILLKDEYMDSKDTLYHDFMTRFSSVIYSTLYTTELIKFFDTVISVQDKSISVSILVNNRFQEAIATEMSKQPLVHLKVLTSRDNLTYDSIYVKDANTLSKYTPEPEGKHLFICEYGFNVDYLDGQPFPNTDITTKLSQLNEIYVIDPYSSLVKPERD